MMQPDADFQNDESLIQSERKPLALKDVFAKHFFYIALLVFTLGISALFL